MPLFKTHRVLAVSLVSLSIALAGCAASSDSVDADGDAELDQTHSAFTSTSKIVGDWKKLETGYECLAAMQYFYPDKFDVSLPLAGDHWTGGCGPHGACHMWLDEIPSAKDWERIKNDGKHEPVTYDLIVYPPIGSDIWGHVAAVDHVANGKIYVMDDNYVAHHTKSKEPHTVDWPAYGWYHLKKLGESPVKVEDSGGDCVTGGLYCGGDKVTGSSSALYKCEGGGKATKVETCAHGCAVRPGENDACRPCVVGGLYCGGDKISGNSSTLYKCDSEGQGAVFEHCSKGCSVNAFSDDSCK